MKDDPFVFDIKGKSRGNPRVRFVTFGFKVFEINSNEKGKFVENRSLGDNALFLGDNAAVSVDASRFPGIKANCIHYTENLRREGGKDIGIYNKEDGSLRPCYEGAESLNFICPPLLVHPSSF
ncbi:hypothetical protein RHMOL_Rhmol02G0279800 [Rhododendron molle]|uniref:Uncharacterized protein n=1 Tax=Rhododendron molle TaxID=49168 RepID=A0ACC0PVF0_RHOML|nr:hypothetical protein RHMOL_Rhmol02G0279800 [Rhododendron molle]